MYTHDDTVWGPISGQPPLILRRVLPYFSFYQANRDPPLRLTDSGFLLCMSSNGTGLVGPSSGAHCVCIYPTVFLGAPSWRNGRADYCPAKTASGGRLATTRAGAFHIITTQRPARLWEKPEGFVIPLTVLQVRTLLGSVHPVNFCPLEYRPWLPLLKAIFLNHRSYHSLTFNGTRATSHCSPFTFIYERGPRLCSSSWSAALLCKWPCRLLKEQLKRSPCAT